MHTVEVMNSDDFLFSIDGKKSSIDDLFKDFNKYDRVGVITSTPGGVAGTSALLMAAVARFYDCYRPNLGSEPGQVFIYPEYFVFHLGEQIQMDNLWLDIWPPHKEVVVEDDPEQILEAVNDRGITRLIVEDNVPTEGVFFPETLSSARSRIKTAVAYSPSGRTNEANLEVTSCTAAEGFVIESLNRSEALSDSERIELMKQREGLYRDGRIVESYRTIDVNQALNMLTNHNVKGKTTKAYFDLLASL